MKTNKKEIRRSDFVIAPYLGRSDARATWQIISTIIPVGFLWFLIDWVNRTSSSALIKSLELGPIIFFLILLSSRTFSLMHDCGHNSLFKTSSLNKSVGFLLGVLNAIPQHPWSRGHAFHHKHNGNWDKYRGPSALLTLEDYESLPSLNKKIYAISRHPLMLFPGGFFYLIIKPRLTLAAGIIEFIYLFIKNMIENEESKTVEKSRGIVERIKSHKSNYWYTSGEFLDLTANNFLVILSWLLMSKWLGTGVFWSSYSIVMTISAAIFICVFFVQHNFNNSYAHGSNNWNYVKAAVEGSSNLDIPRWLNWFFADISFHSIHHLCERIPNYKLRECHYKNIDLLNEVKVLGLGDIPNCFDYILWDSKSESLTTIKGAKAMG